MTAADGLTLGRALAAAPVAALTVGGHEDVALAVFAVAALTDAFDGALARRVGVTRRGAILDPLADKILVLASLGALAVTGAAPWWAFASIAARELGVAWLRRAGDGPAASTLGKAKVTLQYLAVAELLAGPAVAGIPLLMLAVSITVASGFAYAVRPARYA